MRTNLRFVNLGFGFVACANEIYMILPTKPKQSQRIMRAAKDAGLFMDCCARRRTRSYIMMDDGRVLACVFSPQTMLGRLNRVCADFVMDAEEEKEVKRLEIEDVDNPDDYSEDEEDVDNTDDEDTEEEDNAPD